MFSVGNDISPDAWILNCFVPLNLRSELANTKPQRHKDTKIDTKMMQGYLAVLDYYMKQSLCLCVFVVIETSFGPSSSSNHQGK
jgi:hypothetical protein